jgi:ABC-type amino acid transport substrate-binding protein
MMKRFSFLCLFFFTSVLCQWNNTFAESDPKNSIENSLDGTIQLTEEEENWLEQKHVVRARVGNTPPLHYFDGQNRGVCVEYLDLLAEKIGFKVEYVHGIPWTDALENIKKQDTVDLLLTAKNVKERRPYMRFSDDYLLMPWVIFSRTDSDFVSSIDDLIGKTVAVEKGYVMQSMIDVGFS